MELSKEQIDQLFKFTEKKYVRWYDLQVEIVDHLATKIEELITKEPALSFESALQRVYTGFGIFGFAMIVREKERALEISTRRIWWKAVGQFFTWPKIAFTACLFMTTQQLYQMVNIEVLQIVFLAVYVVTEMVLRRKTNRTSNANKKLLLLQYGTYESSFFIYQLILVSGKSAVSPYVFAALVVAGTIGRIAYFKLYNSVRQTAREQYPEVFVEA
jgi:hypothetical protein